MHKKKKNCLFYRHWVLAIYLESLKDPALRRKEFDQPEKHLKDLLQVPVNC